MADQFTVAIQKALVGRYVGLKRYTFYPVVALGMPVGVALPHDANTTAGAWGVWTLITAAGASPQVEFWLCGCIILADATVLDEPKAIRIGRGIVADPPVALAEFMFAALVDNIATTAVHGTTQYVPYPVYNPPRSPLSGQAATPTKAAAANITVAVLLATGL